MADFRDLKIEAQRVDRGVVFNDGVMVKHPLAFVALNPDGPWTQALVSVGGKGRPKEIVKAERPRKARNKAKRAKRSRR